MQNPARTTDPIAGSLPRPWLLADIGGTNARFGWLADGSDQVMHVQTLPVAAHPGPAQAAHAYLDALVGVLGSTYQSPRAAAFAVATAVAGDHVAFTNSGWAFSRADTTRALALDALLVLNDFEALALSLPRLKAPQLRPWSGAFTPVDAVRGALAVVGPGTGLGVAGLVPVAGSWVAVPGEGGHTTLAPADDAESALLAALRHSHGHVSAERLLSGIGLPTLHAGVLQMRGEPAVERSTEDIVKAGLDGSDAACAETLAHFCALLGSFAGNAALTFGARGGVFIGGGIVPRLGDFFIASRFRERFDAKGRFRGYLQAIPVAVITDTLAALSGAAFALEQHRRERSG